jgi:hypothetical protein
MGRCNAESAAEMKDRYGVLDLGLDESQDYLISSEFPNAQEAIRRLKSTFNEHHRLPQVYAVSHVTPKSV